MAIALDLACSTDEGLADAVRERVRAKWLQPAWLVVVHRLRADRAAVQREDYAAVACAIQNLQLALHAEGIGTKWSTGAVTRAPQTYEQLGLDEHEHEIEGFISVGMAAHVPTAPSRPPLGTFVTWLA